MIGSTLKGKKKTSTEAPQGPILCPTLLNVLCHALPTPNHTLLTYADDAIIATQQYDLDMTITQLRICREALS